MSGQTPNLAQVIGAALENAFENVFTARPGVVQSYDPITQTASVAAGVKVPFTTELGETEYDDIPVLQDVPVIFPGAGDYSITWPVNPGDTCLLLFCDCDISGWKQSTTGAGVQPHSAHRNHVSDAVAIVGLRILKKAIKPAPPTDAMAITAPLLKLGSAAASQAVVVQSALDAFLLALTSAIITLGAGPASAQLSALQTALGAWSAGTSKVKAE